MYSFETKLSQDNVWIKFNFVDGYFRGYFEHFLKEKKIKYHIKENTIKMKAINFNNVETLENLLKEFINEKYIDEKNKIYFIDEEVKKHSFSNMVIPCISKYEVIGKQIKEDNGSNNKFKVFLTEHAEQIDILFSIFKATSLLTWDNFLRFYENFYELDNKIITEFSELSLLLYKTNILSKTEDFNKNQIIFDRIVCKKENFQSLLKIVPLLEKANVANSDNFLFIIKNIDSIKSIIALLEVFHRNNILPQKENNQKIFKYITDFVSYSANSEHLEEIVLIFQKLEKLTIINQEILDEILDREQHANSILDLINNSNTNGNANNLIKEIKKFPPKILFPFGKIEFGDLFYGFTEVRHIAFKQIKEITVEQAGLHTIDTYNNLTKFFWQIFNQKSEDFSKSENLSMRVAFNFHIFTEPFENEKHKSKEYYNGSNSFGSIMSERNGSKCNAFIKKRCKLGLLWTLGNNKTIHFLLNNVDVNQCFSKAPQKYTYSELRFIYRNWNTLKNYYDKGKLKFWEIDNNSKEFKTSIPPWNDNLNIKLIKNLYTPKNNNKIYCNFFNKKPPFNEFQPQIDFKS